MAISLAQDGSASGASTTPTASINITEAANQTLVAWLAVDNAVDENASFTYDSVAMTIVHESTTNGVYTCLAVLKNPNSGSALSLSGTIDNSRSWGIIWGVINDNDQTTAYDSGTIQHLSSASATSSTLTQTSETNDLVLDFIVVNNKSEAVVSSSGTGQTGFEALTVGENAMAMEGSYFAGAASCVSSWSWSGTAAAVETSINFNVTSAAALDPIRLVWRQ